VIRFALRGLAGRKLRSVLTALAIVLGVATVSGTYVLTDSIKSAFNSIFQTIYVGTDAAITGKSAIDPNSTNNLPAFSESLLAKVRALDPVVAAIGGVGGEADLIGRNGKVISYGGAPHIGFSIDPSQPRFNSIVLKQGQWPGHDEVAIDTGTAGKKHIKPGDTIGVQGMGPVEHLRVSGLFKFTSRGNIGGATLAGFDLATGQRIFDKVGKLDEIRIARKPGYSEAQLLAAIRNIPLPPATKVRTGVAQADEAAKDTNTFINFLQTFLLSFGGIALFVGSFVIANSLSITIAQRTREFATLRTIGASRRQILRAVLIESTAVAVLASVIGLFLGLALAKLLFWLFGQIGFTLPTAGLLLKSRTIVVALLVGILVTVVASLRPAFRATRVPPIAAVREGVTLPPGRFARFRTPASGVLALLGFGLVLLSLFVVHGTGPVLLSMGVGAFFVFLGVAFFSSQLVVPLSHVLGGPAASVAGAPGVLARENSMRNPQRTASTAAALMIGLALVTLVAMLAQGIRASFFGAVNKIWTTDYAVTAQNNFDPISLAVENSLRKTPGVQAVVGVRTGESRAFGAKHSVSGIAPGGSRVFRLDWTQGSPSVLDTLGANGAFVDKNFAKDHHLGLGSPIPLLLPNGKRDVFRLKGIFDPPAGGSPFGAITISSGAFDRLYTNPQNQFVFLTVAGGVTKATTAKLEHTLKSFPNAKLQDRDQFKKNQASFLNNILNVLYVLLALSVVVSLFGIVNTLVLTVFERTREIGMLRAVGTTRWQVRSMITLESIVTSLMGAAIGIGLGILLSVLLIVRVDFLVLAWPIGSLVVFAIAAIVVGLVAAIFPARRAARLNVLQALQYE
jgi:putative ABC transport system permease protein